MNDELYKSTCQCHYCNSPHKNSKHWKKNDMGNSSKLSTKKAYKVRLDSSEWTVKSQQ